MSEIKAQSAPYEMVAGLEVHVQLRTNSKLFSPCPVEALAEPNTRVDVVSLGLPGTLPVLNRQAVALAVAAGLATQCRIRTTSIFARKSYFYPDMPKGYQISQYDRPICESGFLDAELDSGETFRGRIHRIHMEEDAGKTIHDALRGESRVDYNRAGTALVEVVTEPDFRSPEQAVAWLKELHSLVVFLGISDANMEEGNFRCDANVSIRPAGSETLGTKTEIKNLNSFRHIARAIAYEAKRHERVLTGGGTVVQETRLWDDAAGRTESMRSKEEAHDYRYFDDPDLLPLTVDSAWLESIRANLPELPQALRARYQSELGLSAYDARVLTGEPALASYFEAVIAAAPQDPKRAANWVTTELLGALGRDSRSIANCPLPPEALGEVLRAVGDGRISGKMAKQVFERAYGGEAVQDAIAAMGSQITDESELEALVRQVIESDPQSVAQYKSGKTKLMGHFVGLVMKQSRGKANPQAVNALLSRLLSE